MIVDVFGDRALLPRAGWRTQRVVRSLLRPVLDSRREASGSVALEVEEPGNPGAVVRALNQRAARPSDRSLVVLHTGLVVLGDRAILVAGPSHSGKSTVVTALCQLGGASYGSDELTALRIGTGQVLGFAKPISLKRRSWPVVEQTISPAIGWRDTVSWLLPPTAVAHQVISGEVSLAAIVFTHYCGCDANRVSPVGPSDAAFRLCSLATNLEDVSSTGFRAVCDVVRRRPAYLLEYGHAPTAVVELLAMIDP